MTLMSKTHTEDDDILEPTREERLKDVLRRDDIRPGTRRVAERALERLQEGSL